ncbi:hypothetical protein GALMADRAFT_251474 [Galerina marginata CBS 339.88]|uniref:Uncharacterized protein n=1 Tax=Galerina marginata (strain CBS 339.88) TaxID=685588 RepID=A0A067T3S8_GALM3|nr:hypothetical protein GALMADRAFT_251474 [Galerina marginata CBS 339.88]
MEGQEPDFEVLLLWPVLTETFILTPGVCVVKLKITYHQLFTRLIKSPHPSSSLGVNNLCGCTALLSHCQSTPLV